MQTGKTDAAIAELQKAIEIDPTQATAQNNLGVILMQTGQFDGAITHLQIAIENQPDYTEAQNSLAWVLATCPQASLRDGARAVKLALQANKATGGRNPLVLATLAAAYAETGRFPEAVDTAQQALDLANALSNTALADVFRSQLALYKAHTPLRSNSSGR